MLIANLKELNTKTVGIKSKQTKPSKTIITRTILQGMKIPKRTNINTLCHPLCELRSYTYQETAKITKLM